MSKRRNFRLGNTRRNHCVPQELPRKAQQLCHQVRESLSYVIATVTGIDELTVVDVVPANNSSCLCVVLEVDRAPEELALDEIYELLRQKKGRIRFEVASAINRRKTPDLTFVVWGRAAWRDMLD